MDISFSIIMPTYNRKHCIGKAIDSLLAQTYHNFELIIYDDGSTDGTDTYVSEEYGKELKSGKIKYSKSDQNRGAAYTRNEGLKMAKCGWIGYLDTDNSMRNDFLETFACAIEENRSYDIFYAQIEQLQSRIIIGHEFDFDEMFRENFIDLGVFMHSSNIYHELGGFDNSLKRLIDWDLIMRYVEKYPPKFIEKVLLDYYDGSDSTRITNKGLLDESFKRVILKHYERIPNGEFIVRHQKQPGEIVRMSHELQRIHGEVEKKNQEIEHMKASKFWKLRERYLKLKNFNPGYFANLLKKAVGVFKRDGLFIFLKFAYKYLIHGRVYFRLRTGGAVANYKTWIEKNENWNKEEIKKQIDNFSRKPKISVITPVFNVKPAWLDLCIQSVLDQFYENWELCLYDDASTSKETVECLKRWKGKDARIKIKSGEKNQHISGASNEALKMATGEFIALLDNDDELSPHALFEVAKVTNQNENVDFIYSDEDKIEVDGIRSDPFFKPDWSLFQMLSMNYTCHLSVYRKVIVDTIGGFRKGFEGAQDYDLALRFIEKIDPKNIFHIPKVLYHWRKIKGSTAQKFDSKNYASDAGKRAIEEYMRRNNIVGSVEDGIFPGSYRIKRKMKDSPLVSIIIPTKDKADYLKSCVSSVLKKTDYGNYEVMILDTGSKEKATKEFYQEIKNNPKIKIIDYPKAEFNFAEANTWAAQKAQGKYLLFLNNDTEVIGSDWLDSMMEYAQIENVGAVGAKLLYPDKTIQHMGVVIGLREGASHAGVLYPDGQLMGHPFLHAKDVVRNVSAVTGACLLVRKSAFNQVRGFDKIFKIAFNDIDFCLKVRKLGLDVVYTPYAKLIHYESVTFGRPYDNPNRSSEFFEKERDFFRTKWDIANFEDPFYNKNLTLKEESLKLKI